MKQILITVCITLTLAGVGWWFTSNPQIKWEGVDESVVHKFASAAGRPPRDPYINTDQGDLLLFVFLIAGSLGGFVAGYNTYKLFVAPQQQSVSGDRPVATSEEVPPVTEGT